MSPNSSNATTADLTLFTGFRVWGGELWFNPEIDHGFGFSNTLGMAGYPSGEAYKVGANSPYLRLPRAFYRSVVDLGGEEENIEQAANQMERVQSANNVILTMGKFAVTDVFDTNTYAHDPRADFFNWSIVESGAIDYEADALQLQRQTGSAKPDTGFVQRFSSRPGMAINSEQEISSDLGGFAHASVNNGSQEAYDFTTITQKEINFAMERLNNRPRKRLGYRTPNQVFFKSGVALQI